MADMSEAKWSVQNGDIEKVKQALSQPGVSTKHSSLLHF